MTPHYLLALTLIYAPLVVFFFWARKAETVGEGVNRVLIGGIVETLIITGISLL